MKVSEIFVWKADFWIMCWLNHGANVYVLTIDSHSISHCVEYCIDLTFLKFTEKGLFNCGHTNFNLICAEIA